MAVWNDTTAVLAGHLGLILHLTCTVNQQCALAGWKRTLVVSGGNIVEEYLPNRQALAKGVWKLLVCMMKLLDDITMY
jgi:hypothetical protein